MRAQAIEVAWHNESSVWSVDCARSGPGLRFVTSGNDKVARVWRLLENAHDVLSPLAKYPKMRPPGKPTLSKPADPGRAVAAEEKSSPSSSSAPVEWLCDLNGHSTTVNVARFSPSSMIASGADGGELIIWAAAVADSGHEDARGQNRGKERWSQLCFIRGHSADILDLSWSSDGKRLASASVDNTFRVWDVSNPKRALAVITTHDSMVQGVAFDPIDRFIASLGNDRTLAIHFASGYQSNGLCTTSSDEPKAPYFASDMRANVMFRRLSWSPDGSFIACPTGLQVPPTPKPHLHSVHLFARGSWKDPVLQCAGLTKLPIAVAFCPKLFQLRRPPAEDPFFDLPYRMVFAVACLDSILVYDTESFGRPVGQVSRVHYAELTDLSWTSDGSSILVSSCDGSVSVVGLSKEEIGRPLPEENQPTWIREQSRPASTTPCATASTGPGVKQTPLQKHKGASELLTPVTVVPRRRSETNGALPTPNHSNVQNPHARGSAMGTTLSEATENVSDMRTCTADDPARKRLKLEEGEVQG